ncbi:MAG: ATP-binding protein, partial [Planctomycetales bacterium]|nr:ATP-binding protein [Planctomycetales bacterium]
MVDEAFFRWLLKRPEGTTLDFKRDTQLSTKNARNDFIKDIVSMANTERETPSYIVVGVSWTPEGGAVIHGMDKQIDDALLIDAIGTDRIQPIPRFSYTPLVVDGLQVGVIELPIDRSGPFTPLKDFGDQLRQGTVYYRSGSQNSIAVGTKLREITSWFEKGEANASPAEASSHCWDEFLDFVHGFERGRRYVLVTDRIGGDASATLAGLGMPPWSAAIDFDPNSETDGILSKVGAAIRQSRTIHLVVKGDRPQIHPERGAHWFFARGVQGRNATLAPDEHKPWVRSYKKELSEQLSHLHNAFSPSPTCFVVVWQDSSLLRHLRTLFEEIDGHFGDSAEVVIATEHPASFAELAEENEARLVTISVRNLCSGLIDQFGHPTRRPQDRCAVPTKSGAPHSFD